MYCKRFIVLVVIMLAIPMLQACSSPATAKQSVPSTNDQKSPGKSIKLPVSQHVTFEPKREFPEDELE